MPYAFAAALPDPSRQGIVRTGDGAFGFNAMEMDTAVRHGARIVVIVSNNAASHIERYDQEVNYDSSVIGTRLGDADHAALARALGPHGERVTDAAELPGRDPARAQERAGRGRRRHLAGRGLVRRHQGSRLRAGLPGAHAMGRGGACAEAVMGYGDPATYGTKRAIFRDHPDPRDHPGAIDLRSLKKPSSG